MRLRLVRVPQPVPVAQPAAQPVVAQPEDAIAELAAVSPPAPILPRLAKTAGAATGSVSMASSLLGQPALKIGLAVVVIFLAVSCLPIDALAAKFSVLKRIPFSSTVIKALTAGAAAAAVSTSVCE